MAVSPGDIAFDVEQICRKLIFASCDSLLHVPIQSPQTLYPLGKNSYEQKSKMAAEKVVKSHNFAHNIQNVACSISFSMFSRSRNAMVAFKKSSEQRYKK